MPPLAPGDPKDLLDSLSLQAGLETIRFVPFPAGRFLGFGHDGRLFFQKP
jgi:hypothetical protein